MGIFRPIWSHWRCKTWRLNMPRIFWNISTKKTFLSNKALLSNGYKKPSGLYRSFLNKEWPIHLIIQEHKQITIIRWLKTILQLSNLYRHTSLNNSWLDLLGWSRSILQNSKDPYWDPTMAGNMDFLLEK